MVLWSPLRSILTTPEVSTTNAETGHPLAAQASIAVVAASTASASGTEYPDCATCAAAKYGGTKEAQALRVSATAADFIMLVSSAPRCPGCMRADRDLLSSNFFLLIVRPTPVFCFRSSRKTR